MKRREVIGLLSGAVVASPVVVRAQQSGRVHRIGYLGSSTRTPQVELYFRAFFGRLQELGYTEGQNLIVERRFTEGHNERYHALARELVSLKVDLIVAPGTAAALAAKEATSTIPIVTVVVGDPVGSGLVTSLRQPAGNVTGTSSLAAGATAKGFQLLKEIVPDLSRVAVLANPTTTLHLATLQELEAVARMLRVRLHTIHVRTPNEIESAFATMTRELAEALMPLDDPMMALQGRRIGELALRQRLPTVSTERSYPEAGLLMSYGTSFVELFRSAAGYVDKILKGANPAGLPIEQPTKFELVINLRTAKALGLTFPPMLLARADGLIE